MGRLIYSSLATLLIFCFATSTRAQAGSQAASKTAKIAAITVAGNKKCPADQIVSASGLKTGDVVSAEQLQAAADRLAALGLFSSVNYRFSSKEDTISLEFQVQEAPTYPLSFDNFPWFSDEEIAQAIHQEVGLVTNESPESGALLDGITAAIENLLASHQIKGNVKHQLLAAPVGDGMIMQFRVEPPPIKVQSVQFGDALATSSEQLKDRIPDLRGQPYSRFAIEVFENEHLRPLYDSKGYVRAKIGPPQAHLTANPADPGNTGVEISIPITPGPVYAFAGISWQGNTAIGSVNLDSAVEMKPGDPVDGMKIEAVWQKIESAYQSHGFLDEKMDPRPEFDDAAHRVSYHAVIIEGPQYHMGEMVVTGLSVDAEKRLRQEWRIAQGQVFDGGYFDKIAMELAKPSVELFGEMPVHYTQFGHWLRPDPDKHTVDVLLDFK